MKYILTLLMTAAFRLPLLVIIAVTVNLSGTINASQKEKIRTLPKKRNIAEIKAEKKLEPPFQLKDFLTQRVCFENTTPIVNKKEIERPLLNQIYLHHQFKLCSKQNNQKEILFPQIQKNLESLSEFEKFIFQSEISEFENQIAQLTPDKQDDFETLKKKINSLSQSTDKEKLLQKAIELAKELKLENEVQDLQVRLGEHSPRLFPEGKDSFQIAKDQRFNREFKQAVTIYDQVIANPNETAERIFQAMKEKRQTFKMQQKKMEVLIVDAQIIPFVEAQYLKAKAEKDTASKDTTNLDTWRTRLMNETLISARALWTESQINEGRRLVQEKMKILEPETRFDEFYFLFAKMAEEKRDFDEALENYQKINKDSSVYPRMLWASGWIYLRQKKFAAAQKQFEELKDTTPDNGEKIKALFWSAQSLKKSKKSKLAAQKFEEVEKLDPYGYYGILAHRELKLKFKPLTSTKLPSLQKIFNEVDPEKATTIQTLIDYKQRDYLEIGMRQFKDDVEKKILTKATQTTKTKNKKNAPKLASSRRDITSDSEQDLRFGLISAYSYAGLYLPLFQYMSSLPPAEKDAMLDQYPQILFPNDFYDLISSSAKKFKIDVALPLSIIRQESAFNPEARSHAEAYGLMQILPSVARQYQKKAQVSFEDPEELYIPEINVPIGCAFLSDLMKRWNQRFILAVASYNASPRAVNNWLLTRTKSDPLMFIEEIPYEETRGYVKLVMRNQIMYRRITDQKAFSFPEKFLIL